MSSVEITHHWEFLGQNRKDSKVKNLIPIVLIPNRFSFMLCMYVFLFVCLFVFFCVYMLYVYMYRWVMPLFFFLFFFFKYVNVVCKPVATRHTDLFGKSFFSDFCYFIALILSKPNFISQFF